MLEKFYNEQVSYSRKYLIPFLKRNIPNFNFLSILEIGCAEAGFLSVLQQEGIECEGIELNERRAKVAVEKNPNLKIIIGDISGENILEKIGRQYDLIIVREVIEHIQNKDTTFRNLCELLKPNGYLFITFPPKYSPFAGHQQVGRTFLRKLPYIHLFPESLLKILEKTLNENPGYADHLQLHFKTGISIYRFKKFLQKYGFIAIKKQFFIFRPIYKLRYGLPIIKIPNIWILREFICFGCESLLTKQQKNKKHIVNYSLKVLLTFLQYYFILYQTLLSQV
ncbi:MAG: hypothetical protein A2V66_04305 [Ignavibacteria bacterium RBG_13_36_8]|nr:MAG: hypothetical protein A2V66_04305 [Ignavibacteria bacterium RBG_13_36_8]